MERVVLSWFEDGAGMERVVLSWSENGAGVERVVLSRSEDGAGVERVQSRPHRTLEGAGEVSGEQNQVVDPGKSTFT